MEMVAKAIARERSRAGLSLSALAERAGLAKSTLSQLEAGKGNPSVETLWAIATALGAPFSFLFETATPELALIRAADAPPLSAEAAAFAAAPLADCPPTARRDLYRIDLAAGAPRLAAPHPPGTVEHAIVCGGAARVGPEDALETLGPGDYYRYPGDAPHRYEAVSEKAVLLLVMESPR